MAIILYRNIPTTNSLLAKIKHFSESDMRKLGCKPVGYRKLSKSKKGQQRQGTLLALFDMLLGMKCRRKRYRCVKGVGDGGMRR